MWLDLGGWLGRWCHGTQFSRFCTTVFWCFLCNHFRLIFRTLQMKPWFRIRFDLFDLCGSILWRGVFGYGDGTVSSIRLSSVLNNLPLGKKIWIQSSENCSDPKSRNDKNRRDFRPPRDVHWLRSRIFWCLRGQWSSSWCPSWRNWWRTFLFRLLVHEATDHSSSISELYTMKKSQHKPT